MVATNNDGGAALLDSLLHQGSSVIGDTNNFLYISKFGILADVDFPAFFTKNIARICYIDASTGEFWNNILVAIGVGAEIDAKVVGTDIYRHANKCR